MTETTYSVITESAQLVNQGVTLINWALDSCAYVLDEFRSGFVGNFVSIITTGAPTAFSVAVAVFFTMTFIDFVRGR